MKQLLPRYYQACLILALASLANFSFGTIHTVTSSADMLSPGTLRFAVDASSASGDTIMFSISAGDSVVIDLGPIDIQHNLVFIGPGAQTLAFDANSFGQLFTIQPGVQARFYDLGFREGQNSAGNGGAIVNGGDLHLYNCLFHDNFSGQNGGAVANNGTMVIRNTNFWNNSAARGGALFSNTNADADIDTAQFNDNTSTSWGGAIFTATGNANNVMLDHCTFDNNVSQAHGGAFYNNGTSNSIFLNRCEFSRDSVMNASQNGGAIATTAGHMFIDSTRFHHCHSDNYGGAIWAQGSVSLNVCLVDSNTAIDGAGVFLNGATNSINNSSIYENTSSNNGAGVYMSFGTVDITSSTIANNLANGSGAGIYAVNSGNVGISSSTIVYNLSASSQAGGIHCDFGPTVVLEGSIVALNTGGGVAPDILNPGFMLSTSGHNLVGDTSTTNITWQTSDIIGTNANPVDPMLSGIDFSSGLPIYPINCTSPALDAGPLTATSLDQVGNGRVGTPDIGAVELQTAGGAIYTVTSSVDGSVGSLRYAITSTCADTVDFSPALLGSTLSLTGQITVSRDVVIMGLGTGQLTLDGGSSNRHFTIDAGTTVHLHNMTLTNGAAAGNNGGSIWNNGTLEVYEVDFNTNTAGNNGGAIYNAGTVTLSTVNFNGNSAFRGGGYYSNGTGNTSMISTDFDGNSSTNLGGAVYGIGGSSTVYVFSSTKFLNNTATNQGGGLWLSVSTSQISVVNCEFDNNDVTSGTSTAGGMYLYTTTNTTTIDSSSFVNCDAVDDGAGLYVANGDVTVHYTLFQNNISTLGEGGGLYNANGGGTTIDIAFFDGNWAASGGGAAFNGNFNSSITGASFVGNQSTTNSGAAIYVNGHVLNVTNSTFSGNIAGASGAGIGIVNAASNVNLTSNTFTNNVANFNGHQVWIDGGNVNIESNILANGAAQGDLTNTGGTITSNGYNLVGDTTGSSATWLGTDIVGGVLNPLNPGLEGLALNAGSVVPTHNMFCSSPAIDAGSPSAPILDQVGQARVGQADIGAFERQVAGTGTYTVTNLNDAGTGSLRFGIDSTCADTILFDPSLNGNDILLTSGDIDLERDLVILGNGNNQTMIDAGLNSRIFNAYVANKIITVRDLQLKGGNAPQGGALYTNAVFTGTNLHFSANFADDGGAIFSANQGDLVLDSCKIDSSHAANNGGGICILNNTGAQALISNTEFVANTATNNGGAIYMDSISYAEFTKCEIHNNQATLNGGGLYSEGSAGLLDTCQVFQNSAQAGGGVMLNNSAGFGVRATTIFSDTALTGQGGGLYGNNSLVIVENSTISGNVSTAAAGGGLSIDGSSNFNITSTTIATNFAAIAGGGIRIATSGTVGLTNTIVASNGATGSANDIHVASGTINSTGYNFIGDGQNTGMSISWQATDSTGLNAQPADPLLFGLANNGGFTLTHAPECSSPVVDNGDPTLSGTNDQINQPRVNNVDIGAFERQVFTLPDAQLSGSAVLCRNQVASDSLQVDLTGTAPWDIRVSNGSNFNNFTNIQATPFYFTPQDTGTYTITYVSDASCNNYAPNSGSIVIDPSDLDAQISSINFADCNDSNGDATVTGSGGSGNYHYLWTNGDTVMTADSLSAGLWMVTVTDDASGCIVPAVANISNNNAPLITVNAVNPPTCNGDTDGAIDVTVSGGQAPYQYLWSNGVTSEDVNGLDDGPHELTVLDGSGCQATETVLVPEPDAVNVIVNSTDATCGSNDGMAIANVAGGTGNINYAWSSGGTTNSEVGLGFGTYTVTVTDDNGCSDFQPFSISEIGAAAVQIDSTNRPNCSESNGSIYISAAGTGTLTYNWNGGLSNSEDLIGVDEGVYQVEVTDGTGCTAVAATYLANWSPPTPRICAATVDSATQLNLIAWEKESGRQIEKYWIYRESSSAGIYQKIANVPYDSLSQFLDTVSSTQQQAWRYQVRAIDSCGNGSWLSNQVSHRSIHISAQLLPNQTDVLLLWNGYDGMEHDTSFLYRYTNTNGHELLGWTLSNDHQYTDQPPSFDSLFYYVKVNTEDACIVSRAAGNNNNARSNNASVAPPFNGIADAENNEVVQIFPSPNNGEFTLRLVGQFEAKTNLNIYDSRGREVLLQQLTVNGTDNQYYLNLTELEAGIYFIRVQSGDQQHLKRMVIQ